MPSNPVASIRALLQHYSFDPGSNVVDLVVDEWLSEYPAKWVIGAVIESIYQGRFKVSSVNRVLELWCREGRPQHHFDIEFADLVCGKLLKQADKQFESVEKNDRGLSDTSEKPLFQQHSRTNFIREDTRLEPEVDQEVSILSGNIGSKVPNQGIGQWLKLITKL